MGVAFCPLKSKPKLKGATGKAWESIAREECNSLVMPVGSQLDAVLASIKLSVSFAHPKKFYLPPKVLLVQQKKIWILEFSHIRGLISDKIWLCQYNTYEFFSCCKVKEHSLSRLCLPNIDAQNSVARRSTVSILSLCHCNGFIFISFVPNSLCQICLGVAIFSCNPLFRLLRVSYWVIGSIIIIMVIPNEILSYSLILSRFLFPSF